MNQKAVVYLLGLAALAMLCATLLIVDGKVVPDFIGFVIVSAVGSAAGASVPMIVGHEAQPVTLKSTLSPDPAPAPAPSSEPVAPPA